MINSQGSQEVIVTHETPMAFGRSYSSFAVMRAKGRGLLRVMASFFDSSFILFLLIHLFICTNIKKKTDGVNTRALD